MTASLKTSARPEKNTVPPVISKTRRDYNAWVANESMEDYALRFAPRHFRKWSEFQVANTAFGSTSFLVLEAIGGFLSINYGFTNAFWAIAAVGVIIFIISFPISYYGARYNIDIDLLTRSAGFGYIGSTVTSLIYASFTFTLFALEASIMSLALQLYLDIPLAWAHVVSAVTVIPLVAFGITAISRLQLWTQPVWLLLLILPYYAVIQREPDAFLTLRAYFGIAGSGRDFDVLKFGSAATVAFSMVAQIGEQVDFLRFMPPLRKHNRWRWWLGVITAGPGWIVFGMLRQIGGALLAHLALRYGVAPEHAHEPTQMYLIAYGRLFDDPAVVLALTALFVVLCQIKINVTNAYAGSLAWSNFFSRLTHSHPGRVIWLLFNVSIALLLMEFGLFAALEKVLGLFSNMSIAWLSAVAAELMINKPLGLSPRAVEFKRAYLPDLNPVGILATLLASVVSILAYLGLLGPYARAFSAFIALVLAFALAPSLAWAYGKTRYLARDRFRRNHKKTGLCSICENVFEYQDMAYCPVYQGGICSLCCSLDSRCMDACKPGFRLDDYLKKLVLFWLPGGSGGISANALGVRLMLIRYVLLFMLLAILTALFIGLIYYHDLAAARHDPAAYHSLIENFIKVFASLLVFIGLFTWWLVLNEESRRVAQEEIMKQTQRLLLEIEEHKKTDAKLQTAMQLANKANTAKSRFLSSVSHEIRTPLNSILGYAYILEKDPQLPAHRRQAVEILKRSGEHLSALIEDILDIARIEARKIQFRREIFDFSAFVEHLVYTFKTQAERKGLAFYCRIASTLPQHIQGDEKRVGQVLINLLANAVKFTEAGEIIFRIGYSCGVMTFQVSDSGPGIPHDQIQAVFEPFTQLPGANGGAPPVGSGLGLTISKLLTEMMGGELTLASALGKGSTFTVRLFLPKPVMPAVSPEPQESIAGYQGDRKKLLVVDDQDEHRQLVAAILEPLGFAVVMAASGGEALQSLSREPPDLILLDLSMPGLSGFDTAARVRERGFRMPIIVLSANAYSTDRLAAINAGCNDFLAKPIQWPELFTKLKLHLGLVWHYASSEEPEPDTAAADIPPSAELLEKLAGLVKIGDLHHLNQVLIQLDGEYPLFCRNLLSLSNQFRIADIKLRIQDALARTISQDR